MKIRNSLFVILMLSLPAISAEHSDMKMSDMSSSASSQEYMAGMKDMHAKMMAAVNESDPDKAFAKGMVAHHGVRLGNGNYPTLRLNDGFMTKFCLH